MTNTLRAQGIFLYSQRLIRTYLKLGSTTPELGYNVLAVLSEKQNIVGKLPFQCGPVYTPEVALLPKH